MLRMPARYVNAGDFVLGGIDCVEVWTSGDNVIVDIQRDEEGADDNWDDAQVGLPRSRRCEPMCCRGTSECSISSG